MAKSTVFINNRSQAVRLPADMRFPPHIKKVDVRIVGNERVIAPADSSWNSFFMQPGMQATSDFMEHRAEQEQPERESF